MIKAIYSKYCNDEFVQLIHKTDLCDLIVSEDEIILLKNGNNVLINKYVDHPSRDLFSYSEKIKSNGYYNELFEYNKLYLNFKNSASDVGFRKNFFFKGDDRALFLSEPLYVDSNEINGTSVNLSREELEKLFDKDAYDSMYVIDRKGKVLFANNKKNGLVIDNKIIPSDEQIIKMELDSRIANYYISSSFNHNLATTENYKKAHTPKSIDEIRSFHIYGTDMLSFPGFSHMLLTSKNGNFNLQCFRIVFIKKDKFRLTYSQIPIIEPTIDDVLIYSNNEEIKYTWEPYCAFGRDASVLPNVSETKNAGNEQITSREKERKAKKLARVFGKNRK